MKFLEYSILLKKVNEMNIYLYIIGYFFVYLYWRYIIIVFKIYFFCFLWVFFFYIFVILMKFIKWYLFEFEIVDVLLWIVNDFVFI